MSNIGKIPPQAVDAEEAVLGAILLESPAFNKASDILKADDFYKESHKMIYNAMVELNIDNSVIDILTVSDKLKKLGQLDDVGGAYYVSTLTNRLGSAANVIHHSRIVKEKALLRNLIKLGGDTMEKAFIDSADPFDLINELESGVIAIDNLITSTTITASVATDMVEQRVREVMSGSLSSIPTGMPGFDNLIGGLNDSDLVVIGGYSSNGKTATAINMMYNISQSGKKGVFFSYEMTAVQLNSRIISIDSGVNPKFLYRGLSEYSIDSFTESIERVKKLPFLIDECRDNSYFYLRNKIKTLVIRDNIDYIMIDYLQLIDYPGIKNRAEMMGRIANEMKGLAKEVNKPIVLLSQLKRPQTKTRPGLSDLKESGDIENAADVVLLSWIPRAEPTSEDCIDYHYNGKDNEISTLIVDGVQLLHYTIAKGRSYGTGKFLAQIDSNTKISDYQWE